MLTVSLRDSTDTAQSFTFNSDLEKRSVWLYLWAQKGVDPRTLNGPSLVRGLVNAPKDTEVFPGFGATTPWNAYDAVVSAAGQYRAGSPLVNWAEYIAYAT
ncbi:MAG: hypothetical protein RB191_13400 [Terriglobia bacterium]|nr:hypothetical protein [Terriglobia bacterium]